MRIELGTEWIQPPVLEQASLFYDAAARAYLAMQDGEQYQGFCDWLDWPQTEGLNLVRNLLQFKNSLTVDYDCVVLVGIGGSFAGVRAVVDATRPLLSHEKRKPIFYAGAHLCEASHLELLEELGDRYPLVVVVSKSGDTLEPAVGFRLLRMYLEERFGITEASKRTIAVTDAKRGTLCQLAETKGYVKFSIPEGIGGRFSVLTAVGIVPLALAGYAVDKLQEGAASVFEEMQSNHPALHYGAYRHALRLSCLKIEVLSLLSPKLHSFGEWWKQLFGESEGKDKQGLFPASMLYSTDLHSLGQFVQDGTPCLAETFLHFRNPLYVTSGREHRLRVPLSSDIDQIEYLQDRYFNDLNEAAYEASLRSHFAGGVNCLQIRLGRQDEYNIGALFAFMQIACAVSAILQGVHPFNQPGVEEYKKVMFQLLGRPY